MNRFQVTRETLPESGEACSDDIFSNGFFHLPVRRYTGFATRVKDELIHSAQFEAHQHGVVLQSFLCAGLFNSKQMAVEYLSHTPCHSQSAFHVTGGLYA